MYNLPIHVLTDLFYLYHEMELFLDLKRTPSPGIFPTWNTQLFHGKNGQYNYSKFFDGCVTKVSIPFCLYKYMVIFPYQSTRYYFFSIKNRRSLSFSPYTLSFRRYNLSPSLSNKFYPTFEHCYLHLPTPNTVYTRVWRHSTPPTSSMHTKHIRMGRDKSIHVKRCKQTKELLFQFVFVYVLNTIQV